MSFRRAAGWNLNQLFGRLDIRKKLAIAFLGLAGVPLALVGWYAAEQHLQSLSATATQEQRRNLASVRERVQAFLGSVEGDLDFLTGSSSIDSFLQQPGGSTSILDQPRSLTPIEASFEDFLRSKRHYYRLRLLGDAGVELAHVVVLEGSPRRVPSGAWQGTGYRFYRTVLESADAIAFAPVELRNLAPESAGSSDRGPHPVSALSFVQPLRGDDGALRALLVADIDARRLFELLEPTGQRPGEVLALVEPDGHYLFHSARKTDWNTLLATEREFNLYSDLSMPVAERVLAGETGVIVEESDSVITYAPLVEEGYSVFGSYTLVSVIPKDILFAPVRSVRQVIFGAGAFFLVVAGVLALLAAHQFAAPIRALTQDAARLARGEFEAPLDVSTNDEIEDLARSFSTMATTLQERERENVRQREQLNALLDNMGEGVAVVDPTYRVRFLNRFLLERFGPADGRTCFELFLGRSSACEECPSPDPLVDLTACPCREGVAADGRYYEILAYPLENFEGGRAVLEIHRDITERRRMERELERYTQGLESMVRERTRELERSHRKLVQQEKMVAVGQLAAGVAHELGTPLATIMCHSEIAIEDLESLNAKLQEPDGEELPSPGPSMEIVLGEANRCRAIVRELLEFSRPSSGDREPVRVASLVKRAITLVEHDLRKRDLELSAVRLPEKGPIVLGEENALVQVVLNLLLNAADATGAGGVVTVSVGVIDQGSMENVDEARDPLEDREAPDSPDVADGLATLVVEDDGEGMDAEIVARVFEPFFTTKDPGVGTGLGLWVAYNTVADHGGRIEVESSPGAGSRFTITLPLLSPIASRLTDPVRRGNP